MARLPVLSRLRQALRLALAGVVVGWLALAGQAQTPPASPSSGGLLPRLRSIFTPTRTPAPGVVRDQGVIPPAPPRPVAPPLAGVEAAETLEIPVTSVPAQALTQTAQAPVILPTPPRPVLTGTKQPEPAPRQTAPAPQPTPLPPLPAAVEQAPKVLPINLDTVLRLSQDQNGQIAIARERVEEAYASKDIACRCWLPVLEIGPSYWRHEGGIQDFNGKPIHSSYGGLFVGMEVHGRLDLKEAIYGQVKADKDLWEQKAGLSRTTSEQVLRASLAYLDLQAMRLSEAISLELEERFGKLLELAKEWGKIDAKLMGHIPQVEAELAAQRQTTRQMRQLARAAAARLIYLLGLDPCAELQVMDAQMGVIKLVDPSQPIEILVKQATATGPAVRELEGLLSVLHDAQTRAQGPGRFLPALEVKLLEGAFGAGPGSKLDWDNRFDISFHARWNLTALATANAEQRRANSQIHQAQLRLTDLRGELTSQVQAAREASLSKLEQSVQAERQIAQSRQAYDDTLAQMRKNAPMRRANELLAVTRGIGGGQLNYLQAILEHNRAQIELFVLLGQVSEHCAK